MKQGTLITKIVMFILILGVAVYLAVYALQRLADPMVTVMAYQDTLDDSVEAAGVLVRTEQALAGGSGIVDVLPEEGERVAAGEVVAVLYQDSGALERKRQLEALEQEREQLQYALSSGGVDDAAMLDRQILTSIQDLRAGTAGGELSTLESDARVLRAQVLQRELVYSSSGGAAALAEAIAGLDLQISRLQAQSTYDTTSVYAPCSGLFSGLADGYESILTPDALDTITAAQLKAIADGTSPGSPSSLGKLVTGDRWYFACVVDAASARRLQSGDAVTVAFSRDYTGEVSMRVERVGGEEAEGCVVVLSATRQLSQVTLLRSQTVDLVFHRYTGIRVPKKALRIETQTSEGADGEELQTQITYVYTVVGAQAERKPVEIVGEGADYYLVTPADDAGKRLLRAGDEIIVDVPDLYDGKVVLK